MKAKDEDHLESLVSKLERSGRYSILRRFEPVADYYDGSELADYGTDIPPSDISVGLIVDVETTGLDPSQHSIIELALLPFEYVESSGLVGLVHDYVRFYEDPGEPIPSEIVELTKITDEKVAGQSISDDVVNNLISGADLVVAHNAAFDRRFLERRLPEFANVNWACSLKEVPWKSLGFSSSTLEFLMFKKCKQFFEAHSASEDCKALLHVLATPFPNGNTPFQMLLESATKKTIRIWATGAPFETKEALKLRKYRWNPGDDGNPKAWFLDVPEDKVTEECSWLSSSVYGGHGGWTLDEFDARRRYSDR